MFAVSLYTIAGLVSSAAVGAILSGIGLGLAEVADRETFRAALTVGGVVLLLREAGLISLPLPQATRQTKSFTGSRVAWLRSAAFWGFDLGMLFTTRITLSGVWLVVGIVVLNASPVFGIALLGAYWAGRASSAWSGPWLTAGDSGVLWVHEFARYRPVLHKVHGLGLVCAVVMLGSGI